MRSAVAVVLHACYKPVLDTHVDKLYSSRALPGIFKKSNTDNSSTLKSYQQYKTTYIQEWYDIDSMIL